MPVGKRTADGVMPIAAGEYGRMAHPEGWRWWVKPPSYGFPAASLSDEHSVHEHANGAITVVGLMVLRLTDGREWRGYLVDGEWNTMGDSVLIPPAQMERLARLERSG